MKTCKYNLRRRNPKTFRRKINKSRRKKRDPRKKNTRKSTRKRRRKRGGGKSTKRAQSNTKSAARPQGNKYGANKYGANKDGVTVLKVMNPATQNDSVEATEIREYNKIKAMMFKNDENKDGAFAGLRELAEHNTLAKKWFEHASQPRHRDDHPGANPPFINSLKDNRNNTNTHTPDGKRPDYFTQPDDGS